MAGGSGYPTGYAPGLTPDQIGNIQQQGFTYTPTTSIGTPTGGAQFQQPQGYSGLTPDQIQAVQRQGFFNQPTATTGQSAGGNLWDRITKGLGQMGATPQAPQGPTFAPAPPPPLLQGRAGGPTPLPQFQQAPFVPGQDMRGNLPNQLAAIQYLMRQA